MSEETQIDISVISHDQNDFNKLAKEVGDSLEDKSQLTISTTGMKASGKSADASLVLQVIGIAFVTVQTGVAVASLLYNFKKDKIGVSFVISNSKTGKKVRIYETDSLKKIQKKMKKIMKKESAFDRIVKRLKGSG